MVNLLRNFKTDDTGGAPWIAPSAASPLAQQSVHSNVRVSILVALVPVAGAAAQAPLATVDSNALMGFETPAGRIVKGRATTMALSTTTIRTQGNLA
jgi:hypothetical protein